MTGFRSWKIPTGHCWKNSRNSRNCFRHGFHESTRILISVFRISAFQLLPWRTGSCSRSRQDGQKRKTFNPPASESSSPITFSLKLPHLRQDTLNRRKRLSAGVWGGAYSSRLWKKRAAPNFILPFYPAIWTFAVQPPFQLSAFRISAFSSSSSRR